VCVELIFIFSFLISFLLDLDDHEIMVRVFKVSVNT
jgi:hypothetical protein